MEFEFIVTSALYAQELLWRTFSHFINKISSKLRIIK